MSIARESSACIVSFQHGIAAIGDQDLANAGNLGDYLRDELDRFNLWSSNVNVYGRANMSLDFRLREIPDVVALFLDQLGIIRCRLDQREKPTPPLRRRPKSEKRRN